MQVKTTMKYHLTPVRMTIRKEKQARTRVGKNESKGEKSHAVGGNINWYGHYGK